mgnify:CR=1 FL=1
MTPITQLSGMPRIRAAFTGWLRAITLITITQSVVAGLVSEIVTAVTFKGVIQPLNKEAIALKPEGERSWEWLQIHAIAGSLNLKTNDKIQFNSNKYKVMALLDYSASGFIEYHAVRDYE